VAEAERVPRVSSARRSEPSGPEAAVAKWFAYAFGRVEDLVYIGLAILLTALAVGLLVDGVLAFVRATSAGELSIRVATLLDRMLLILMIVEILYTVQVSLREHTLVPEPFLIVAMIAGVRRILVLTAEFSEILEEGGTAFTNAMLELGVLTGMVLALVVALVLLRRRSSTAVADKS
jgi:hypothetical protein